MKEFTKERRYTILSYVLWVTAWALIIIVVEGGYSVLWTIVSAVLITVDSTKREIDAYRRGVINAEKALLDEINSIDASRGTHTAYSLGYISPREEQQDHETPYCNPRV